MHLRARAWLVQAQVGWSALFEDILGMLWCVPWCCWCVAFLWAKAVGKCSGEGCIFALTSFFCLNAARCILELSSPEICTDFHD